MKIALLTTDSREALKTYNTPVPHFGTAPEALLQGFALVPEVEVHVLSCIRQPVNAPARLAPNIFFHSLLVPKLGWMRTGYQGCIRAVRREAQSHPARQLCMARAPSGIARSTRFSPVSPMC